MFVGAGNPAFACSGRSAAAARRAEFSASVGAVPIFAGLLREQPTIDTPRASSRIPVDARWQLNGGSFDITESPWARSHATCF